MLQFFREGGIAMWPILIFGLLSVASSVRYAMTPIRKHLFLTGGLLLLLVTVVLHASLLDVASVFSYLEDPGRVPGEALGRTLIVGLRESTRPGLLGGFFVIFSLAAVCVGILRSPAASGAETLAK